MDTVQWKNLKPCEALAKFALICALIFSPTVFAKDRVALLTAPALPQVSIAEKYPGATISDVIDGVKLIRMTKYYNGKPVRINVVEANGLEVKPVLASEKLNSRRTITTIAKNSDAIVALNGTFFKPETGVPLGTLMIEGKLYTGPVYDRVAMGIFDSGFDMARLQLNATLRSGKEIIKVDNINQPRMLADYVLAYTPEWGAQAPAPPAGGKSLTLLDGTVVVGPAEKLYNIDEKAKLTIKTTPGWEKAKHIISGGPYLVKNGEIFVDTAEQRLNAIGGRNPRSAIGYTAEGNLILVAVDGREGSSVGMTLTELANFMHSIGCINAMNLDGGGSTVMYVNGVIVNRPAQTGGIPVSNAIVLAR